MNDHSAMSFLVRLMTNADIDEVWRLHLDLFEVKYDRRTIQSFMRPDYFALLLVDTDKDSEIIGVSVSQRMWVSRCSGERVCYLSTFGIKREYQRCGLGSFLFRLTCNLLRTHYGVIRMSLHMLASNRGVYDFYEKLGMSAWKLLPGYYHFDSTPRDSIVMCAPLDTIRNENRRDDIIVPLEIEDLLLTRDHVHFYSSWFRAP